MRERRKTLSARQWHNLSGWWHCGSVALQPLPACRRLIGMQVIVPAREIDEKLDREEGATAVPAVSSFLAAFH